MLTISAADFTVMAGMVADRTHSLVTGGGNRKYIVLPTPMPGYNVLLTEEELLDLHYLLGMADTEMTTDAFLRLFESDDPD